MRRETGELARNTAFSDGLWSQPLVLRRAGGGGNAAEDGRAQEKRLEHSLQLPRPAALVSSAVQWARCPVLRRPCEWVRGPVILPV